MHCLGEARWCTVLTRLRGALSRRGPGALFRRGPMVHCLDEARGALSRRDPGVHCLDETQGCTV